MNRVPAAFLAAAILFAPVTARAHAHLTHSVPARESKLQTSPKVIQLWFSERPELSMTFAQLTSADGHSYRLGPVEQDTSDRLGVVFPVLDELPEGRYAMTWRTAASDGHPSNGHFIFAVGETSVATGLDASAPTIAPRTTRQKKPSTLTDTSTDNADPSSSLASSLARALSFVGILVAIGSVAFALAVLTRAQAIPHTDRELMRNRAAIVGLVGAVAIAFAALARLYLESEMMQAMAVMPPMSGATSTQMVIHTAWGVAFVIQFSCAIVALVAFALAARGIKSAWYLAAIAAIALGVTPALSGHAAAMARLTSVMILIDWLHVLGAASWLGTLSCVIGIGIPIALRQRGDTRWKSISSLVNEFSSVALPSVAIVLASGVFASWMHLSHISDLWTTTYGKALTVKLTLVAMTLAIGAYNFKRVQPDLGIATGTARLRKSGTAELVTGLLIVLVTGFLTGVSP